MLLLHLLAMLLLLRISNVTSSPFHEHNIHQLSHVEN